MKHWQGQIFPIVLLSILALLSFALMRAVDFPPARNDGKLRHDPDAQVENFTVLRFNEQGQLSYRLVAPFMEHYPDDDSSMITAPRLTHYAPDAPITTITSRQAKVTSKANTAYLWGDVEIRRDASAQRPEMVARMPDLTVNTEENTGFTNNAVEITQGPSWLKGVGMNFDAKASTYALHSHVTGMFHRSKARP